MVACWMDPNHSQECGSMSSSGIENGYLTKLSLSDVGYCNMESASDHLYFLHDQWIGTGVWLIQLTASLRSLQDWPIYGNKSS